MTDLKVTRRKGAYVYQHFCRIQTPGFPADKDCMADYFGAKNN